MFTYLFGLISELFLADKVTDKDVTILTQLGAWLDAIFANLFKA